MVARDAPQTRSVQCTNEASRRQQQKRMRKAKLAAGRESKRKTGSRGLKGPARAPTVLINIKKRLLAARTATSLALGWGQRKSALRHPRGYSTAGRSGQGTARSFNQARPPPIVNCGRVMRLCVCMAERETKQQDKLPAAPSSVAHYWVDLFANKPFPRRLLQGASPFDR